MAMETEDISQKLCLCGGVFFTLLIDAHKDLIKTDRNLADTAESENLWDLNMVANGKKPDWASGKINVTSMKTLTSDYKNCKRNSEEYIDLGTTDTRDAMKYDMKNSYEVILQRMSTYVFKYLFSNPESNVNIGFEGNNTLTTLVGRIIYIIQEDNGIDKEAKFCISKNKYISKTELCAARSFELQPFLLSVLYFIVKNRSDTRIGRGTIETIKSKWLDEDPSKIEEDPSESKVKEISTGITLTVLSYKKTAVGIDPEKNGEEAQARKIDNTASPASLSFYSNNSKTDPPHHQIRIMPGSNTAKISSKYKLLEQLPECRSCFRSRYHENAAITSIFSNRNHVVFLYGEAGQGKSELAKQYASAYKNNHPDAAVVFAVYTDSIERTIRDKITILGLNQGKDESDAKYYNRKLVKLKAISEDQSVLLIIDDFNVDPDSDPDPELESFLQGKYKVIFTTRNPHPQYRDREVKVGVLGDVNILLSVFREYYEAASRYPLPPDDIPYVKELINRFNCHTYMVELLAKQLAASYISAKELLQRYYEYGIHHPYGETVEGHSFRCTPYEHIRAVFSVSSLSEEECRILREMSLLDIYQIEPELFKLWAQLEDYNVINDLIHKSWVRSENRVFSIHPLVRDIFYADPQLKPDTDNCGSFLEEIGKWMYHAWSRSDEDNRKGVQHILAIARYFRPFKNGDVLTWSRIPDFLWQVGKFKDAVDYGEALYNECVLRNDTDNMDIGYAARILGECYHNYGDETTALEWFERAKYFMEEPGRQGNDDLAWVYERLSQVYTYKHDLEKAMECAQNVLTIRENLESRMSMGEKVTCYVERWNPYSRENAATGIAIAYQGIARIYLEQGNYEEALENARKAVEKMAKVPDDKVAAATKIYPKFCLGLCYYRKGKNSNMTEDFQKASDLLNECLSVQEKSLGSASRTVLNTKEYLADAYAAIDMLEDAEKLYKSIIAELADKDKEHGPDDAKKLEEIRRKAKFTSSHASDRHKILK